MSRIAAAVLMLAAVPAAAASAPPPKTAGQVLAAHRAATSIGPDPCRTSTDDEIVVCGKLASPYSAKLSETMAGDSSRYGGNRAGQMQEMQAAWAPCRLRGEPCQSGGINVLAIAGVLIKGVKALTDGE